MTAYIPPNPAAGSPQLRIWTPRRTPAKTYGGMLDNTVAGGIAAGMGVRETLVKESAEEASLPASLVVGGARAAGAVSYFYERDWRAGGETGLLQPEVEYVYDLEVDESVVPRPGDDEVADFCLMTVDQVGVLRVWGGGGVLFLTGLCRSNRNWHKGILSPTAHSVCLGPPPSLLCEADGLQCLLYPSLPRPPCDH